MIIALGSKTPEQWATHFAEVERQLVEAQEAAATYHEAWEDAAVYWKDAVREARSVAGELIRDIRCALLGSCPLEPLSTYDLAFEYYPWLKEDN